MPTIFKRLRDLYGNQPVYYHIEYTPEQTPSVSGMGARELYGTQANLHAVVSFLADSVAQLPLKTYVREGETDRRRDRSSKAALLLYRPNADQTAYEFWNAFMTEYYLMGLATLWLLPDADSESGWQMRLIPREWIKDTGRLTNYAPEYIVVEAENSQNRIVIPRTDFDQFKMYAPGNPSGYQSPIAALKVTLNEQIQADRFRTEVWQSSGRFNAYVTRPKDVAPWDDETRKRFAAAFREQWGKGGENAGKMPILEDGMEIKPYQFNAQQAQFAETKQLSREDVAAAYHVNPSLIWHTATQTYASAKDNARALYADCLGPVLQMIQQRVNAFVLPKIGADPNTYVEFDLTEKLKGSFEERASIIQASVGGPWLTRNEARADNNLPPVPGGDDLIVPLNVVQGGQASPQDTHMEEQEPMTTIPTEEAGCDCPRCKKKAEVLRLKGKSEREENEELASVIRRFFKRQALSVLPKISAGREDWWNAERWNEELAEDIIPVINRICDRHAKDTAEKIGTKYNAEITRNYLAAMAKGRATAINASTERHLTDAIELETEDENAPTPADVFKAREGQDADLLGMSLATAVASWALTEASRQAINQGFMGSIEKEWVTGENARPTHEAMNGERVGIDGVFSNGARWPGDDNLDPEESCGCNCSTEVIITTEG